MTPRVCQHISPWTAPASSSSQPALMCALIPNSLTMAEPAPSICKKFRKLPRSSHGETCCCLPLSFCLFLAVSFYLPLVTATCTQVCVCVCYLCHRHFQLQKNTGLISSAEACDPFRNLKKKIGITLKGDK